MKRWSNSGLVAVAAGSFAFCCLCVLFLGGFVRSDNAKKALDNRVKGATFAGEGMAWRMLAWADENGTIPANPLRGGIEQRDAYLQSIAQIDNLGDDGTARLNWTPRGPSNVGGRTRSVIVHPGDSNILWAGSVSGGIWKSTDAGTNWFAGNGTIANYAIGSMAIDPTNPQVLYAGTGEGFFLWDSLQGAGLFKSTNGGITWAGPQLGTDKIMHINRISVAPTPGGQLILMANSGNPMEQVGGGIWRSENGGSAWTREISDAKNAHYVSFAPSDSTKAIADIITNTCPFPGECHRVMFSIDSGDGWTTSTIRFFNEPKNVTHDFANPTRIELAYAASNINIVYALYIRNGGTKIARSDNGGAFFEEIAPNMEFEIGPGYYCTSLWVSPTDPDLIIAGGTDLHRSPDGGANFTQISDGYILKQDPHVDQHCVVADPNYDGENVKRVYVCTDGGVFRTEDITTATRDNGDWVSLNDSFQTTQYYGADGDGTTGMLYGGTQDNATLRILGGSQTAVYAYGGDGGYSAIDPSDNSFCYGEYVNGVLHRSTDCTTTATPHPPTSPIHAGISDVPNHASFISPFVLDPNDPARMYFGGSSVWRSDNVRASGQPAWTEIKMNPTPLPSPSGSTKPLRISAVAVAPSNSDIVWISECALSEPGHPGRLWKTSNATATSPTQVNWDLVDDNTTQNPLSAKRYITRIVIDPDDPLTVYVAMGGFGLQAPDNLWKTTNGGADWDDITGPDPEEGGLPEVPIRGFARHPTNASKLYVGTEIGIYVSENDGALWRPVMEGPGSVSIDELIFMRVDPHASPQPTPSTKLLAATHGRGLWIADVDSPANGNKALNDFDGDGRSDISVMRLGPSPSPSATPTGTPPQSTWYIRRTSEGYFSHGWGVEGDQIAAEDFNGDGKTDIAVFRPSDGYWYWWDGTSQISAQWGQSGDIAVPADYDDDGTADFAVFRPSTGEWHIDRSTDGYLSVQWGQEGDIPFAADFNGNGKADPGVARLKDGVWYLYFAIDRYAVVQFGLADDIPVIGDYDGDGKADIAVWRPGDGYWYITYASNEWAGPNYSSIPFGTEGDVPVPGDYDGDGKTDIAVWRRSNGHWYIRQSTNGLNIVHFGADGDKPVAGKTVDGINARNAAHEADGERLPLPADARPARRSAKLR